MPMTTYLKNALLDHSTGKTAYTQPSTYVCLFTVDPGAGGSFTNELPAANGYARIQITGAEWAAASAGAVTTTTGGDVTFTCSGSAWSAVTYMGLADSATQGAGNLLYYDDITSATLNPGDTLTFAVGDIDITIT